MNELTQRGITALKSGDRVTARKLLAGAIQQDANDIVAWLWLTATVDNDDDRISCLEQVLKIDPDNQVAARGLAQIQARRGRTESPLENSPVVSQPEPENQPQPMPEPSQPSAPVIQVEAPRTASELAPEPPESPQAAALFAEPADEALQEDNSPLAEMETASPTGLPAVPVPAIAADETREQRHSVPSEDYAASVDTGQPPRKIFRVRPSQVPALLFFWIFLFGALAVGRLLGKFPELAFPITGGLWLLLELVVLYVIIRNLTVRYELTNQALDMRFLGKRAHILISDIFDAQMDQSFFQQILGIGHIDLNVSINGELAHVRLRDIPQCRTRLDQILALLRERQNA